MQNNLSDLLCFNSNDDLWPMGNDGRWMIDDAFCSFLSFTFCFVKEGAFKKSAAICDMSYNYHECGDAFVKD